MNHLLHLIEWMIGFYASVFAQVGSKEGFNPPFTGYVNGAYISGFTLCQLARQLGLQLMVRLMASNCHQLLMYKVRLQINQALQQGFLRF